MAHCTRGCEEAARVSHHPRAERKSRSYQTPLSKTDVMILRLHLPHER